MKDFKCTVCGGPTEKVWENAAKTRYGMRCKKGHPKVSDKSGHSIEYPTILVLREELDK